MTITRFGLQIVNFRYPGVPDAKLFEHVARIATTAEQAGFDSLWLMDNLHQIKGVGPENDPIPEAYTFLAGLAARTERMRVGVTYSGVTIP